MALNVLILIVYKNMFAPKMSTEHLRVPTAVKHSKVLMYADDTCLYFSSKNVQDLTTLNKDLKFVREYLKCNKLKLNVKKCEFFVVGT